MTHLPHQLPLGTAADYSLFMRLSWTHSSLPSSASSSQAKRPRPYSSSQLVRGKECLNRAKILSHSPPLLGITKGVNAANYVFWLNSLQPNVRPTAENQARGPASGYCVDLKDVRFSYPLRPEIPVLRGLNLKVCFYNLITGTHPITH